MEKHEPPSNHDTPEEQLEIYNNFNEVTFQKLTELNKTTNENLDKNQKDIKKKKNELYEQGYDQRTVTLKLNKKNVFNQINDILKKGPIKSILLGSGLLTIISSDKPSINLYKKFFILLFDHPFGAVFDLVKIFTLNIFAIRIAYQFP